MISGPRAAKKLPERAELLQVLEYDPQTGDIRWKHSGKIAGWIGACGYRQVKIGGRKGLTAYAHRIAYKMATGEEPGELDHINRNRGDNRLANLRPATRTLQLLNRERRGYYRRGKSFRAEIKAHGKKKCLGSFPTEEQAKAAYEAAKAELLNGR